MLADAHQLRFKPHSHADPPHVASQDSRGQVLDLVLPDLEERLRQRRSLCRGNDPNQLGARCQAGGRQGLLHLFEYPCSTHLRTRELLALTLAGQLGLLGPRQQGFQPVNIEQGRPRTTELPTFGRLDLVEHGADVRVRSGQEDDEARLLGRPLATSERHGHNAFLIELILRQAIASIGSQQRLHLPFRKEAPIRLLRILIEVVHHPPLIVPHVQLRLGQLGPQGEIVELEARKLELCARLYDRLSRAQQRKLAICAIPCAELLAGDDAVHRTAVSDHNAAHCGTDEDAAALALVNENACNVVH
mmetsp:Transcript_101244/g.264012  ORF Transcript_101244/g.264012 Transcript_101244/m.264012 type:complete len:304 (+) Transcript_101244:79-990(+)